jgi:predicted PurR-regulated permease PerM
MEQNDAPTRGGHANTALLASLLVALLLAFLVFRFYLLTFAVAASVALLLGPAQDRLAARWGGRQGLAATLLVILCTVVVLLPFLSYGVLLARQAVGFADWLAPRIAPGALEAFVRDTLPKRYPLLASLLVRATGSGDAAAIVSLALAKVADLTNWAAEALLTGLAAALFDGVLFVMMLFFLLRDGTLIREQLRGVSPLTRNQETDLLDHLTRTVKGTLLSMVVVPLVQGVVAFAGFVIFGVPSPLLWSVMVVFAALIPLIGSPLAWVPAGLYLLFDGQTGRGWGMLAYGLLVISMVDNIVKPLIMKNAARIHTLLGFLCILGGVQAFGPKGLIVGPVILSLVLSAYRIYRFDVLRWRGDDDGAPSPGV